MDHVVGIQYTSSYSPTKRITFPEGDFNGLPAHVWPKNASRDDNGVVSIAGVSLPELAEEFGTPLFVVDEDDFRSRCRDLARAYQGPERVHYASKAFLTREIARWVAQEGLSLDVASYGELRVAQAADFPAGRITAHGNNKSAQYLQACVSAGVEHVVLDSFQEIASLGAEAERQGKVQPVLVRVTPGVDAHTHEFIATSHEDQKFGFSLASGAAKQAAEQAFHHPWLDLRGLHCHVGSQVFDAEGFSLAAKRLMRLQNTLQEELDTRLPVLDLGGGYGIAYTENDTPLDVQAVAADLIARVKAEADRLGLEAPTIMVEPGRAIAGPSTVTVYEVGTIKDVHVTDDLTRRYIAVDGGMSDNIRPALYQAEYDARVVSRLCEGELCDSRVVGSHCESGDILIADQRYPEDIRPGDLLALAATGAYCFAMASRYNMFTRPAVVSVKDGKARLMVRRETIEDFLAMEA
ncbi:diaminopimelate decarboxylase [Corynebacterium pseudopelargi]|uniref:Diaminopimelate decarboxylase n=1 Tax=Corynebacterium pseudopelargi TaxID=2080757 RepID=A0A3G6IZL5_9CORY|nr:diaminopimelate decarboxylase [Corynebacterium pseudopelargi]AZA09500.1 Diaminopimelate decarboxylase [Corynebacterium pseudopelargi]